MAQNTETLISVMWHRRYWLMLLWVASLVTKFGLFELYLKHEHRYWDPDSVVYDQVARSIISGQGIVNPNGAPHFYRVPGYPLFLAACYQVCGSDPVCALRLQIVLFSTITPLLFGLGWLLSGSELLALMLAMWSVVHVGYTLFAGLFLSDALYTWLFTIFLLALCFAMQRSNLWLMFIAGGLLGIAGLVRPVAHYTLAATLMVFIITKVSWRGVLLQSYAVSAGWLIVVGPWLLRNYLLTGCLFFHTLSGTHFLRHTAARVVMEAQQCSYSDALNTVVHEYNNTWKQHKLANNIQTREVAECIAAEAITLATVKKHPVIFIKQAVINMTKTAGSLYSGSLLVIDNDGALPEYSNQRSLREAVQRFLTPIVQHRWVRWIVWWEGLMHLLMLTGLAVAGIRAFTNRSVRCATWVAVPFVGVFFAITLSCGIARLRLPIESPIGILAISSWMWAISKKWVLRQ